MMQSATLAIIGCTTGRALRDATDHLTAAEPTKIVLLEGRWSQNWTFAQNSASL